MKWAGFWALLCALATSGLCTEPSASNAANTKNPYSAIAARNVFGLRPPQVIRRELLPPPLPKVMLTGITTILGDKRALFKIQFPARPREPIKIEYCILTEGQGHGSIEVLEIDDKAGTVKLDNSGTVMAISLEKQPPTPPPTAARTNPTRPRFLVRTAAR